MSSEVQMFIDRVWKQIERKMAVEVTRVDRAIPYIAENGKYEKDFAKKDICWWTNGFWGGILWQMYHATNEEIYKKMACDVEFELDRAFADSMHLDHDVGFMWLHTAVAHWRLTQDPKALNRGILAAHFLAGRYNPAGKYLCAWNEGRPGWMIIDCLMNLSLLYWASDVLEDPRFRQIAENHADTALKFLVRENGACYHIGILDPNTGELLQTPAGQGYAAGSVWSRGQAWGIYGFSLSYKHTHKKEYLTTAKKVAEYFMTQVKLTEYIPRCDFSAPDIPEVWDTTAGCIAACGLLELASFVTGEEASFYKKNAIQLLQAIEKKYCNWDISEDGIVTGGTVSYGDIYGTEVNSFVHVPIIYGDYFFIEAILRLKNMDIFLW